MARKTGRGDRGVACWGCWEDWWNPIVQTMKHRTNMALDGLDTLRHERTTPEATQQVAPSNSSSSSGLRSNLCYCSFF